MALFPVFGKPPSGPRLQRILNAESYREGPFHNLVPTDMRLKDISFFKLLGKMFNKPKDTVPPKPLDVVRTDLQSLSDGQVVWFRHSSYLIKLNGTTILVDPVFSNNAAPVSFFAKAFPVTTTYKAEDLPDI